MIIFDIGACVGLFIDDSFEKYGEKIEKLYAFEPHKKNYEELVRKYGDNKKINLYNHAVSNFDGLARLYKKCKHHPTGDNIGNAGSSLKSDKSNVDTNAFDLVEVVRLQDFIVANEITNIDLLKIDSEGSEYDILEDILESKMYNHIQKIYFEDHGRKVPSIKAKEEIIIVEIFKLGIQEKFFLQRDHLTYEPLQGRARG